MILLGVRPRRLPAVASMVLDRLKGRGVVEVCEDQFTSGQPSGMLYLYATDGSGESANIPLWEDRSPAKTIEGVVAWLMGAGIPVSVTAAKDAESWRPKVRVERAPLEVAPPEPKPPKLARGVHPDQIGFGF